MSAAELAVYFKDQPPKTIFADRSLLMRTEFVKFAKGISIAAYESRIIELHETMHSYSFLGRIFRAVFSNLPWNLKKRICALYHEMLREKVQRAEDRKREQQEKITLQKQEQARNEYCQEVCTLLAADAEWRSIGQCISHEKCLQRTAALEQLRAGNDTRQERSYAVTAETVSFAEQYEISTRSLLNTYSNCYEDQLHAELLELLDEAVTISDYYALQPCNVFFDALGNGIALGLEANRQHKTILAKTWTDYSWAVIEVMKGMGEGIVLGTQHTVEPVLHPMHTLQNFVYSLGAITGYCAHAIGTALRWNEMLERGEALLMISEMDAVAEQIAAIGAICAKELASTSNREIAKHGVALCIEGILFHKAFTIVYNLCCRIRPLIATLVSSLRTKEALLCSGNGKLIVLDRVPTTAEHIGNQLLMQAEEQDVISGGVRFFIRKISYEEIITAIEKVEPNRIHHILADKHLWTKVCGNANDWAEIRKILIEVIQKGNIVKVSSEIIKFALNIKNEIVEVTCRYTPNKIFDIVNAWVKKI
jgi:hypothetical protein